MRRRQLLDCLGAAGMLSALGQLAPVAQAAQEPAGADYKALVCVFLLGGNDGNHMVVPLDERHADHAKSRTGTALALSREQWLPLPGADGRAGFGLNPALAPLLPVWADSRLTLLFNTGALVEPLSRSTYLRGGRKPDNLFSHSDQQEFAQGLGDDSPGRPGWGLRLARGVRPVVGAAGRLPPLISMAGNQGLFRGDVRASLVLPARGNFGLSGSGSDAANAARMDALRALWAQDPTAVGRQAGDIVASALDAAGFVNPIINPPTGAATASPVSAAFAAVKSDLGQQLLRVARLVQARSLVGNRRQVFFVSLGGFDTHTNQRAEQDRLLGDLAASLKAFDDAMQALGVGTQVTAFTMSDFARTLKVNNSAGTDHGWGNHHLVLGGAVRGRQTYGSYPQLALGGADDATREGRWIPSTSYDQMVATLARWFGSDESVLAAIAPNLARFDQRDLGFLA